MRFSANKTRVAFGLPYLLIELFYIDMPVVRTGARIVTWLPKFLGCIDNQIFLPVVLRRARLVRSRVPLVMMKFNNRFLKWNVIFLK